MNVFTFNSIASHLFALVKDLIESSWPSVRNDGRGTCNTDHCLYEFSSSSQIHPPVLATLSNGHSPMVSGEFPIQISPLCLCVCVFSNRGPESRSRCLCLLCKHLSVKLWWLTNRINCNSNSLELRIAAFLGSTCECKAALREPAFALATPLSDQYRSVGFGWLEKTKCEQVQVQVSEQ